MIQYFYTRFGEIYPGYEYPEPTLPGYKVIIQANKSNAYQLLTSADKTIEKIEEYGWVLSNDVITRIVNHNQLPAVKPPTQSQSFYGEFDKKNLFIFGAGASANCVYGEAKAGYLADPLRPPLGNGLFDKCFKDHYASYKGVKESLVILQGQGVDVEVLFEEEWTEIHRHNNQEILSRHINIQYYLQRLLGFLSNHIIENYSSKNLYALLSYKLQKIHAASRKNEYGRTSFKKFAFVSFNQDNLLEHYITQYFKRPISKMDDYIEVNNSPYCIFKPHGSFNWGWKFPAIVGTGNNTQEWLYENNIDFDTLYFEMLGDPIGIVDWSRFGYESAINQHSLGKLTVDKSKIQLITENNSDQFFPALLLPYRDKDEFTMPASHHDNMIGYLFHIETIFIIGWKGNEAAFNLVLIKYGTNIKKIVIADLNPGAIKKNLQPLLLKNNIEVKVYNDFEDFVLNGLEEEIQ